MAMGWNSPRAGQWRDGVDTKGHLDREHFLHISLHHAPCNLRTEWVMKELCWKCSSDHNYAINYRCLPCQTREPQDKPWLALNSPTQCSQTYSNTDEAENWKPISPCAPEFCGQSFEYRSKLYGHYTTHYKCELLFLLTPDDKCPSFVSLIEPSVFEGF